MLMIVETRASIDIPELDEVPGASLVGGTAAELTDVTGEELPVASGLDRVTPDEGGNEPEAAEDEESLNIDITKKIKKRQRPVTDATTPNQNCNK